MSLSASGWHPSIFQSLLAWCGIAVHLGVDISELWKKKPTKDSGCCCGGFFSSALKNSDTFYRFLTLYINFFTDFFVSTVQITALFKCDLMLVAHGCIGSMKCVAEMFPW